MGNDSDLFVNTAHDDILSYFKKQDGNYLKRVQMLAESMYLDAKLELNKEKRIELASKAIQLQEHFIVNSKEYSFKVEHKLEEIMVFRS